MGLMKIKVKAVANLFSNLLLVSMALTHCGPADESDDVTEAELERRQEEAFSLAGNYGESTGDKTASLVIENEDDFHNIRVTFDLGRALKDVERKEIELALHDKVERITDQEIADIIAALERKLDGNLVMGEGSQFKSRGGENVVLDGEGLVSEAVVERREEEFHAIATNNTVESYVVSSHFYFTAFADGSPIDYRITRNTDRDGKSASGDKGLFLAISQVIKNGSYEKSRHIVCRLKLQLSSLALR